MSQESLDQGFGLARAARERIERRAGLLNALREAAGTEAKTLVDLCCYGEVVWHTDERFRQSKGGRKDNVNDLAQSLRTAARALRNSNIPGFGKIEAIVPGRGAIYEGALRRRFGGSLPDHADDQPFPVPLWAYLDAIADFVKAMGRQAPDHADCYPPAGSKTSRQRFLLKYLKRTLRDLRLDLPAHLTADLATALLDEDVSSEDLRKA